MADTYQVTGQRQTVEPTDTGSIARGVEITFTTKPSNVTSTVVVPESQYTPDEVRRILEAAAANVEAVHTL
jgi:hypothetical protein